MRLLESLFGSLRRCLDGFPDKRRELNVSYTMGDIGMAAFSVLFMQSPSFLAPQRRFEEGHGRSNCESLFGLSKIPSDNHIRDMPDPASPELLHPVYDAVIEELGGVAGGLDILPPPGWPYADRPRRHAASLFQEYPLPTQHARRDNGLPHLPIMG
jgi:hypothetical protein